MPINARPQLPLRVLVPDDEGLSHIAAHPDLVGVRYDPHAAPTAEMRGAAAIVVAMTPAAEVRAFIDRLDGGVRVIQALSAGVEHWDGYVPDGVLLANASGAHGAGVAEWIVAVLLRHFRNLDRFSLAQTEARWDWSREGTLLGRRIAVLGAGDLARSARAVLEPFECTVDLYGRTARDDVRVIADLPEAVGEYDIVIIAVPDTADTRHLVDATFLARLKDGAVLVNAGRGPTVNTAALIAEAAGGRLHAILDVTDPEPLPDGHHLWSTPGITITPHIAGSIPGVWDRAWVTVLSNLQRWARGKPLANVVSGQGQERGDGATTRSRE